MLLFHTFGEVLTKWLPIGLWLHRNQNVLDVKLHNTSAFMSFPLYHCLLALGVILNFDVLINEYFAIKW